MRTWIIGLTLLAAGLVRAGLITDDFNRADTLGVIGTNTLSSIGNNWVGTGDRKWKIASFELETSGGSGSTYLYNQGQETLNSVAGTSFTQTVDVAVNNSHPLAWCGMAAILILTAASVG
jgi:hypothetical protein